MARIPLGISRLDQIFGGGAPAGSVVLLAGEVGAGAREFLYTSAVMTALAEEDPELFDLYYGSLPEAATLPDEVHYVSFTDDEDAIRREMAFVFEEALVEAAIDPISFLDLSMEYFQPTPVPTEWYTDRLTDIGGLSTRTERQGVLDAFGEYLSSNAPGNLVLVDSVTDLLGALDEELRWSDVAMLVRGLKKASNRWGGVILLLVNHNVLTETQLGGLMDATDGSLVFEWESGGSERARTLVVKQFRGVLSRLEEEDVVRFETEIHDGGFDISNVRKIR